MRAIAVRNTLKKGARFLMFQDSPGEVMQANIFKKFYWWEQQSVDKMEEYFGCKLIFRSWKAVNERARAVSDSEAEAVSGDWAVHCEGVRPAQLLQSAKLYLAIKEVIDEVGGVEGVGANCLIESFHCDTTPCLVWNMLFERDGIIWACGGPSPCSPPSSVPGPGKPIMMTNLYPFLVGMAALALSASNISGHPGSDNHALGVPAAIWFAPAASAPSGRCGPRCWLS